MLHTADLHSHLFPEHLRISEADALHGLGPEGVAVAVGGAARLGAVLEAERETAERSVYVDAGDLFEGTAVFALFGGVPEQRVQELLSVDATTIGNHDLDAGRGALEARAPGRGPPLVALNIGPDAGLGVVPSVVLERNGVRIAVVGLARDPERPPDLRACAASVNEAVAALRSDADVVLLLSHLGRDEDTALVPLTTGLDAVLGGHTHDVLSPPESVPDCDGSVAPALGCRSRPVPVVHSGAYGRYVGRLDLVVSDEPSDLGGGAAGRRAAVVDARYRLVPVNGDRGEQSEVSRFLEPYLQRLQASGAEEPIAWAPRAVERSAPDGGDSVLGNFVAGALRLELQADLSIINSTALRADLPEGVVTREALFDALPFPDPVVGVLLTGQEIARGLRQAAEAGCGRGRRTQVQVDRLRVAFSCGAPPGASASLDGQPLEDARIYRVVTTDFLAGPGRWLQPASAPIPAGGSLRDAVQAHVARLPACLDPSGGGLPCLEPASGADVDGRISWH